MAIWGQIQVRKNTCAIELLDDDDEVNNGPLIPMKSHGSLDPDILQVMEEKKIPVHEDENIESKKQIYRGSDDVLDLLDALNKPSEKNSVPHLTASNEINSCDLVRVCSVLDVGDDLHYDGHNINSTSLKQAYEGPTPSSQDPGEPADGIFISAPTVQCKRNDAASAKELMQAIKRAKRETEKAEKEVEKEHQKRLRLANTREVTDRAQATSESFRASQVRAKEKARTKSHAAKEITVVLKGSIIRMCHLREALDEVGVAVCDVAEHSDCSASSLSPLSSSSSFRSTLCKGVTGLIKWAWRPSTLGGVHTHPQRSSDRSRIPLTLVHVSSLW